MVGRRRGTQNLQYKAKEQEEFFRRLDHGGTIRAVAAELGLSVDACYRWRQEATVSTPRVESRMYTAVEKAEFFPTTEAHGQRLEGREGARLRQDHLLQMGASSRDLHG